MNTSRFVISAWIAAGLLAVTLVVLPLAMSALPALQLAGDPNGTTVIDWP